MHIPTLARLSLLFALFVSVTPLVHAQSQVFVQNNSSHDLVIKDIELGGDKLNRKAWKKGATDIAAGKREKVLTINRSGKFNWMDPTPRFIEPGKTVIFSTRIGLASQADSSEFQLRQKLLGTGKSSKMWHAAATDIDTLDWANDENNYTIAWKPADNINLSVSFRTHKKKKNVHLVYVFSDQPD